MEASVRSPGRLRDGGSITGRERRNTDRAGSMQGASG